MGCGFTRRVSLSVQASAHPREECNNDHCKTQLPILPISRSPISVFKSEYELETTAEDPRQVLSVLPMFKHAPEVLCSVTSKGMDLRTTRSKIDM